MVESSGRGGGRGGRGSPGRNLALSLYLQYCVPPTVLYSTGFLLRRNFNPIYASRILSLSSHSSNAVSVHSLLALTHPFRTRSPRRLRILALPSILTSWSSLADSRAILPSWLMRIASDQDFATIHSHP